jgi:hypothetical protein
MAGTKSSSLGRHRRLELRDSQPPIAAQSPSDDFEFGSDNSSTGIRSDQMERYQGEAEAEEDDGADEQYYDCEEGEEAEKEEESEGDELEGKRNHFSGRRRRSSVAYDNFWTESMEDKLQNTWSDEDEAMLQKVTRKWVREGTVVTMSGIL